MGLGKTFVGSEKLWELNTPYNLVICQKSQINDWKHHFETHYDYKVFVYENQSLDKLPEDSILIVNYDKAWRRPSLQELQDFTLLLDESSLIKNDKAKRTKFILNLNPDNVILLSGTPTGGKYEELWSQLHLLGWDISKKTYLNQYMEWKYDKRIGHPKIVGYKNVERLKKKMHDYGARFMKTEEVFDLPEQNFVEVKCKSTPAYKEFERHHIITFEGNEYIGDSTSTKRLYVRQFAGHLNKNKLDRLKELLESTEDRILIFYNWNAEYEVLRKMCEGLNKPVSAIKGGLVDKKNYEEKDNAVTLIQYQAGSKGHNLQKSNKIIYFSPPDSVENWMQSLKRVHRIGQERPVFYYQLVTINSIEGKIYDALSRGVSYTDKLFEKDYGE